MIEYKITLTEAEDKALRHVALDPQEWIDNAVHNRCRIAIDEISSKEMQRRLDAGETISGTKEDIVLSANIKSAAELQKEAEEQMAKDLPPTPAG